jgi:hypothetical protein
MQSFDPWCVFGLFCCAGPLIFGFVCVRLGISIGRRGMPHLQSPLSFGRQRYASDSNKEAREPLLQRVREQQREHEKV